MEINITVSVAVYCKTCGAPAEGTASYRNGNEVVRVVPCRRCVIEEAEKIMSVQRAELLGEKQKENTCST